MSHLCPEQKYWSENGKVSAVFRPASTPPNIGKSGIRRDALHYLATTDVTRGEFGLDRVEMRPRAGGPRKHFHQRIFEQVSQLAYASQGERAAFFEEHDSYVVE
jgi:hypothetical protein